MSPCLFISCVALDMSVSISKASAQQQNGGNKEPILKGLGEEQIGHIYKSVS